jgi:hypothetical protein
VGGEAEAEDEMSVDSSDMIDVWMLMTTDDCR